MMKKSLVLVVAGILCLLLAASGCTSSSPATPSPVATATPAAPAAAPAESPAVVSPSASPATEDLSWAGTWNSTWLERNGNRTISVLTLSQKGPEVTGNYSYTYAGEGTYTGSLNATVQGTTLAGSYAESDDDSGFFVFTLAENRTAFTGRWVHAENQSELAGSPLFWNGVRE